MSSIIERLTEGVVNRDMRSESHALLSKWEKTGLLEGLNTDRARGSMARLLENQAKELLRESSSMSAGDVEGFAAVAFPIVRRVCRGPKDAEAAERVQQLRALAGGAVKLYRRACWVQGALAKYADQEGMLHVVSYNLYL